MTDWGKYRKLYPAVNEQVFLDHAALSPLSTNIVKRCDEYLTAFSKYGILKWSEWDENVGKVRKLAAELVNCSPDEIAFTANTTDSILFVVEGIDWQGGDNIVSVEREFVANYYPWNALRAEGVHLKLAPQTEGRVRIEDIEELIDDRTRLVAISWVQFLSGFRVSLEKLGAICRDRGVYLAVDAIQGLGGLKLDLQKSPVDFLFCGGHKWLLSPLGTGIFYCQKEHIDKLRLRRYGWMSVEDPMNFSDLEQPLKKNAQRFEYSNQNQLGIAGMGESIKTFLTIGSEEIEKRILYLTDKVVDILKDTGFEIFSSRKESEKSGIITFKGAKYPEKLHEKLLAENIVVSLREGMIRISPHFYNNEDDLDKLASALRRYK